MSALLDDETTTVVLDALDFTATCEYPKSGEHPAQVVMRCRHCQESAMVCTTHLAALRTVAAGRELECTHCAAVEYAFDALVEVVPL